jgi:hypothetical protein
LSIVVLTQNNLCKIIPKTNKNIEVYKNLYLKKYDIRKAANKVIITSAIAKPNNLYEWIPLSGSPRMFLYLHKFIM